jgi:hypothetical protein
MADPDWDRFCFTPGQEGLFAYHQALREAWGDLGISIQQLQHLPYLERYQLSCGKARARVQYHYRRNLKVSTIGAVPGAVSDPALLEQALGPMETALDAASSRDAELSDPFLYAFRQRLEQALAGTDIRVVTAEPLQYRLRVEFQWAEGRTRIDFCYNGRKQWTMAREVGGAGVAKALLERLQQVMEDTE